MHLYVHQYGCGMYLHIQLHTFAICNMNLFFLHTDPAKAASMHFDVHVGKILLEVVQILMTAQWIIISGGGDAKAAKAVCNSAYKYKRTARIKYAASWEEVVEIQAAYRITHVNHPLAQWVRADPANYAWATAYGMELSKEYIRRRGCRHGSAEAIEWFHGHPPPSSANWPAPVYKRSSLKKDGTFIRGTVLRADLTPVWGCTPVPTCVPSHCIRATLVSSYLTCYIREKAHLKHKVNLRRLKHADQLKEQKRRALLQKQNAEDKARRERVMQMQGVAAREAKREVVVIILEKRSWAESMGLA